MLDRELIAIGYKWSENNPSIFIINTCAVTRKAERETRQLIYQTRRKWENTKIIVTGCAATKWINENIKVEGVDWIIDNNNKEFLAQLIAGSAALPIQSGSRHLQSTSFLSSMDKFLNSGRLLLKIQDGCQRFCTFCIVPYLRGQPKSVPIFQLIKAIKTPRGWPANKDSPGVEESENIKEVILTAINTQAYGFDTGEKFTDLIETILKETNIKRLSFGSVHPWSINCEFIKLYEKYKGDDRLVKFLHIPLQSGSNKILTLMKRGYTRDEFMEKLKQLEKIYPMTFFGTDIITGFLEENGRDFADTYDFLKDSPISRFHVFRFSKREKTAAYFMVKKMKEPTPAEKNKRAKALIRLSNEKYLQFMNNHIGKTFPALFLERRKDGYQEVLLNNQFPVIVKSEKNLMGQIKTVKIKSIKKSCLYGLIS